MERFIYTILIAIAISPPFILTKPLFWSKTTTTTTTAATTTSSSSSSSSNLNSTNITNFNNGNRVEVPLSVTQTGSSVSSSVITSVLDQYFGDLNITVPTGRRSARDIRTIFASNTVNASDIQTCINAYPFDYETAINTAVSNVFNCISGDSRTLPTNNRTIVRDLIERFINQTSNILPKHRTVRTFFNGSQTNIIQCALEASDDIAQQALDNAQDINDCIANGTTTTSTTTSGTTTTTASSTSTTTPTTTTVTTTTTAG